MKIPRPEHPTPQWERKNWRNLNGEWEFEFDFGKSAKSRKIWENKHLDNKIMVPFCPESKLSGIGYTDFINGAVYKKDFKITKEELLGNVLLHFGAVDYKSEIYVNGSFAGEHKGGYTSFSFNITHLLKEGVNTLFVIVEDDVRNGLQPAGKQATQYASSGCDYTRTTGIWQTVWLEIIPKEYIKSAKFYPDIENGTLAIQGETEGAQILNIQADFKGKCVATSKIKSSGGFFTTELKLSELHLWDVETPNLYDITFSYGDDVVKSYFGMRSTEFKGTKFLLNGKPLFMRTVLDQGFYPDGIYTAPTDNDLIKDIEISKALGFNGARLHEKVFESRFLYYCDKLGYIAWGEYPNWKLEHSNPLATEIYMNEWQEAIERDFNHPAIIGWCPLNETWGYEEQSEKNALISSIYKLTKRLDPTRPCIDVSGNFHAVSSVYDVHDYTQDVTEFTNRWDGFSKLKKEGKKIDVEYFGEGQFSPKLPEYKQEPVFISEYGGIQWNTNDNSGWGYGTAPKSEQEFIQRYKGLTTALLKNPDICGFCYTQLYDIEQEINGLYTYERTPKFDVKTFKKINTQKAKIEE